MALCAALSYFIGSLFMDIFELAVLTFMFVRQKNDTELMSVYGPDATEIKKIEDEIEKEDHSKYISKDTKALMSDRKTGEE